MISQMPDLTVTPGAVSGPAAFASRRAVTQGRSTWCSCTTRSRSPCCSRSKTSDFCKKGEGGPFVGDGVLAPGGAQPGQTSGGGLAYTHPGAFGAFLLVEATRQLRGECGDRQVRRCPDGAGARHRRRVVGDVDGDLGNGGHAMSEAFAGTRAQRGVRAVLGGHRRRHQLVMQRCEVVPSAGLVSAASFVRSCGEFSLRWEQLSGHGVVYAVSVHHRAAHPAFADRVPYSVVLVDLDEGARMMSNVFGPRTRGRGCGLRGVAASRGRTKPTDLRAAMSAGTELQRAREELVLRHVAGENDRDLEAVMATFTHPRYEIIPSATVYDGDEAVRQMILRQWEELPWMHYTAEAIYHGEHGLVVETRTTCPGTAIDMLSINLFGFRRDGTHPRALLLRPHAFRGSAAVDERYRTIKQKSSCCILVQPK